MKSFRRFEMERYQSTWEHEVRFNLSESGVEPLTLGELLGLAETPVSELLPAALEYNPSNGSAELRERVAALYPGAGAGNVLVTNGGAEANYVVSWSLLGPGDEVVFMTPNYMQVAGLARNFGAVVKAWPLLEERGWQPDPAALDELVGERTRLILVTHPNNPTGAVLEASVMDAVVSAAERVGAWIVADEIYRGAELEGDESATFWGCSERVLVTSGLSKAYGLPGLRLGWTLAPQALVEDLWARKDYTSISMGVLSDRLASLALSPPTRERLIARTRGILNRNWEVLDGWLRERSDFFSWRAPRAGAIVYVRYDLPIDSWNLAERLRTEVDCLIVPGVHFEMEGYLRLGFGPATERLRRALEGCATVVDRLRAAA